MKKQDLKIERIQNPEIRIEDIQKVIQQSKLILESKPVKKTETNRWHIIRKVTFVYGWKCFALQIMLAVSMLLFIGFIVPAQEETPFIPFMSVGGLLLSLAISFEIVRSDIYQMKELEYTCPYAPKKVLLYKVLLLNLISIIGICISAWLVSKQYHVTFSALLINGCIPFLLLNGLCLHLPDKYSEVSTLTLLYGTTLGLFIFLQVTYSVWWLELLQVGGMWMLLILIFYNGYALYHQNRRGFQL